MKKLYALLAMQFLVIALFASHVPLNEAQTLAISYYSHYAPGAPIPVIRDVNTTEYNNISTFYTFNFASGGFVLIAADDASIPVLGYSFEGSMPRETDNPATKEWLEGYSRQIYLIVTNKLNNKSTSQEWDAMRNGQFPVMSQDVNPLLTTLWDQGCYYNALCPPASGGACGHVWTGCVATAMAQIMKYHNYPPQGVGSNTYTDPTYGVQTADFGATTYNWSSMPNSVTSSNNAVATLMYHAGVSVNMQYSTSGSGAFSEDVPPALLNYFNYHPDITIKYLNDYPNVEDWRNLLRADLDQQLPVYYSGSGSAGHAFVFDGYHMSDGKFHVNWGWSGSSNGWFAIGGLNPSGENFNQANAAVLHIKPYNPNLIVRIIHPVDNAVIGEGYAVNIQAVILRGSATVLKLFIDSIERFSTTNDTLAFTWNTSHDDLGSHEVRAYAYSATDTVYYRINLNVAEWISQSSGFTAPSRGLNYMSAVDSNIVWASAFDNNLPTGACSDFTMTTDGGNTWTPGTITNTQGLASAMIFGMSATKAYIAMYKVSGTKPQGIYVTNDGGATWTRQTTALFSNTASFPDCVHFFNQNEGWALGDPINGEFEIYTTTDGGTTWVAVPGANIPNPVSGEFGIVGYYSAVHDSLWFGTNKGRVYHSTDKGYTWTVSTVPALDGKYIKPSFRTGMHGLVQDKDQGTTGAISETFDGGQTWTPVTTTGTIYATDLSYVPNTPNTWVSTGSLGTNGSSYSFNGGHDWTDFQGTQGALYMQMSWVNNHCGWAGGVNTDSTENGAYKYIGFLIPPLPAPLNLQAVAIGHDAHLSWQQPGFDPTSETLLGYNVYRDGLKLNLTVVTDLVYVDYGLDPGTYNYCVKALYNLGESGGECKDLDVAVSVPGHTGDSQLSIYPNPAKENVTIQSHSRISEINLYDHSGRQVFRSIVNNSAITLQVSSFPAGLYFLRVTTTKGIVNKKLVIE